MIHQEPVTLSEKVFLQLQKAIVKGDIVGGSKLNESELASAYGVSRVPLREAIRQLEIRGLVVRKPRFGVTVASLSLPELIEIYQIREALEGMACRLAAEKMGADEILSLRHLLGEHETLIRRAEGKSYYQDEGDFDFHYRIVHGSHNQKLKKLLWSDLYHLVRMYRCRFSVSVGRPEIAFKEHEHIVDAIEARDPELAEMLMRRHISSARQNIQEKYGALTASKNIHGKYISEGVNNE